MQEFKDRLKMARKNAKVTQAQLAKLVGTTQGSISDLESGRNRTTTNLVAIAGILNVNPTWLATGQGQMKPRTSMAELQAQMDAIIAKDRAKTALKRDVLDIKIPVPVISWVAAGSWTDSGEGVTLEDCFETLPRPHNLSKDGFALVVRGESMLPEFRPNEYIYVEPQIGFWDLKNGDLVVVRETNNNEATFKQLVLGETSEDMYLRPLNPNWHEQKMVPKSEWELVGKVVGKWVKY